jgi:predicted nucleic-acid-binding Zn-ribbon protein
MSHYEIIPMQCPKCGSTNHFKNYNSINITTTPELKKAIMNDDIFKFECQYCHHVEYFRHPLFYHDTKNKMMLQYAKDPEEIEQTLAALKAEGLDLADYTIRWTSNWYVFKEKMQIFDHHRDDRILAIYKENMLKKFYEEYPEAGHAVVFYHADQGEKLVVVSEHMKAKFYYFPEQWYANMMMNPHVHKLLKYDTSIDVNEDYVKRVYNLDISVVIAKIQTDSFVDIYALHHLDFAKTGDHVLLEDKGKEIEGVILKLEVMDARDVPAHVRFIKHIIKRRSIDDIEVSNHLEQIAKALYHENEVQLLSQLLHVLSEVKIYLPLIKDDKTGELNREVIRTNNHEPVMPNLHERRRSQTLCPRNYCL